MQTEQNQEEPTLLALISPECESSSNVTWIYYNPDSSSGGQFVYTYMSYDDIFNAMDTSDPLEYLESHCEQEVMDRGTEGFDGVAEEFMTDSEDISSRDEDYLDKLFALTEPRFAIYQLKGGEDLRDYRFEPADRLKKNGLYVDRENYNRVYRGRLKADETLEDIYERFNLNHPQDFRGHSLSVSDIVAVKSNGTIAAYYVDRVGFTRVPDFTLSREERKARRTLTDNLTAMILPRNRHLPIRTICLLRSATLNLVTLLLSPMKPYRSSQQKKQSRRKKPFSLICLATLWRSTGLPNRRRQLHGHRILLLTSKHGLTTQAAQNRLSWSILQHLKKQRRGLMS